MLQKKKESGSLAARDLTNLVSPEKYIVDSAYLTTLLVVVPKSEYKEWWAKYETLTKFVLPRSSQKIFEDSENGLFSVVLFKRVAEDFKNAARENKFIVRKYEPNTNLDPAAKQKQVSERDRQKRNLLRWCKTNFAEVFTAWIHLKCIRGFVESILRFGLPADFQAMLLLPKSKQEKKLRDTLNEMYKDVGINLGEEEFNFNGSLGSGDRFFRFVYIEINLDMK